MSNLTLFMHTSLDGFVAGPNGEMDWINVDEEIFDYIGNRVDEADTALYGRVTFEMMEAYWPTAGDQPNASKHDIHHSRWYMNANKFVLSKTLKGEHLKNTTIISDNIATKINELKTKTEKGILIFGSPGASHSLMKENLIDEFWLFINPILLGEGIPVFKNVKDRTKLKLMSHHVFKSGVICVHYTRKS
ncbi:MAG TPA: dihydrofolate reductase family protein [Puia sp.]|nr:dihydrofolate reductase family protein [Puia sp.]